MVVVLVFFLQSNVARFKSVTAVISQGDLNLVADQLRQQEDEGLDIREPRSPYLMFGGGAVLRFQKDDPEQEGGRFVQDQAEWLEAAC